MAKKVQIENEKGNLFSKLVKSVKILCGIGLVALIVIINPFNIPKILKNNYPKDVLNH